MNGEIFCYYTNSNNKRGFLADDRVLSMIVMAEGVWALQWSASNEWVVVSGGCDGAIRFWDIRQAGCFRVLDQFQSQTGRRPPIPKGTATKAKVLALHLYSMSCTRKKTQLRKRNRSVYYRCIAI